MTLVHLVRHGETVWHRENRYAGSSDVALNQIGRAQAEVLARWALTAQLSRVVCSDLARARETAARAAAASGVTLEVDARLREIDFGRGEGMTAAEMEREFPEARAAFVRAPASSSLPDGEPGSDAVQRAGTVLAEIAAAGSSTLVVAHTTLARLLLCHLLDLPLDRYRRVFPSIGNGTVTTLELPPDAASAADLAGRAALLRFNAPV